MAAYEDRSGLIWFGNSNGGINKYNPKCACFEHYFHDPDEKNSLNFNNISAILEAPAGSGILWIGTSGRGFNRFDTKEYVFKHYIHQPQNPNSLNNDFVYCLYEDHSGFLWIGTEVGLMHRLRKENPGKAFYPLREDMVCPNMKRTSLDLVRDALKEMTNIIKVPEEIRIPAKKALDAMLAIQ